MPIPSSDLDVHLADLSTPGVGFGTFRMAGADCRQGVADALAVGYRFIDTAEAYGNEEEVGAAIAASSVDRDDLFLCTKILPDRTADEAVAAAQGCLRRLGVDYVDLLLLHWPALEVPNAQTLEGMARLVDDGSVRAIGVSNFTTRLIDEVADPFNVRVNQVEYHPYLSQQALLAQAEERDLAVHAYCPVARGAVGGDEVLADIGAAHGISPAQVALRWLAQQPRVAAVPKSSDPARRRENFAIFDVTLSEQEMAAIFALARPDGRIVDPQRAPEWDV